MFNRGKLKGSTTGGRGNLDLVMPGLCLPRHYFEWSRYMYEDFFNWLLNPVIEMKNVLFV